MEEKEIIKYKGNYKGVAKKIIIVSIIFTIICFVIGGINGVINDYNSDKKDELEDIADAKYKLYISIKNERYKLQYGTTAYEEKTEEMDEAYDVYQEAWDTYIKYTYKWREDDLLYYIGFGGIGFIVLTILFYKYISKMAITVTNTRVYGKKAFGKRVDLPLDTISAVGTSFLKGIDIGTSSGRIHFKGIMNNDEIHHAISYLLNERQANKKQETRPVTSNTEEIKKYKDLLDSGIISQEEFEAKKKQLLGL